MRSSYQNKVRKQQEKLSAQDAFEIEQNRISALYQLIKSRPQGMKRYEIQKCTHWGSGIYERTMTQCRQIHPDIKYDRIRHISIIENKMIRNLFKE